jgi:hypothetical protein
LDNRDPRLSAEPESLSDADLAEVLSHAYRSEPIPPCRVCGSKLSVQSAGGGNATVWGCSGWVPSADGTDLERAPGRSVADEHYSRSRWTQYQAGDDRVLELVRRMSKAKSGL